jgi:hypothetical protein
LAVLVSSLVVGQARHREYLSTAPAFVGVWENAVDAPDGQASLAIRLVNQRLAGCLLWTDADPFTTSPTRQKKIAFTNARLSGGSAVADHATMLLLHDQGGLRQPVRFTATRNPETETMRVDVRDRGQPDSPIISVTASRTTRIRGHCEPDD